MLDSYRLRLLVAVADTGSIAGAAATVGCSAAAASQQLAVLEREARAQLLERSARSVRLSNAGRLLTDHARRILADLDTAARAVAAAGSETAAHLRIASFATATRRVVAPAMIAMRRRHPGTELTFTEMEPEESVPAVAAGRVDVALTHQYAGFPGPSVRGLHEQLVFTDPLLLAVPATLAADPEPPGPAGAELRAYAGADWISGISAQGFQAVTEMACHVAGFEPRIRSRADTYPVQLDLVAAGLGVALVPRSAAARRPGVALLEITAPAHLARTVHVTTRTSDRSPAVAAFRQELVRHRRRGPGPP
ncbi:LysR substrate-binding domain-containing protein [Jidongwangia harbinensis]|uniref:LysR substrate-binding domain-containing protein n=1 Tax=Jidongwangia harbinensis TaxID=2878561 RepID=UPI001CD9CA10|nr:LysR substrate-binding domain-containing protein [Jidongwangia harbinensis]MCA2218954.1 LysR family transcriptional regulator [Jidongwangia harbinensis]